MTLQPYSLLMIAGIVVTLFFWIRLSRKDSELLFIYWSALSGAFVGAKVVYIAAEGRLHFGASDMWLQLATGKSILGALLGGYLTVEVAKHALGCRRATGDWFAIITPIGIILGRFGCLIHGRCAGRICEASWFTIKDVNGIPRWPAVPAEIGFNAAALIAVLALRRWKLLPCQHFHLYLIAYGLFRFFHEFLRDTPRLVGGWSGYQFAALALAGFGTWCFWARAHSKAGDARPLALGECIRANGTRQKIEVLADRLRAISKRRLCQSDGCGSSPDPSETDGLAGRKDTIA